MPPASIGADGSWITELPYTVITSFLYTSLTQSFALTWSNESHFLPLVALGSSTWFLKRWCEMRLRNTIRWVNDKHLLIQYSKDTHFNHGKNYRGQSAAPCRWPPSATTPHCIQHPARRSEHWYCCLTDRKLSTQRTILQQSLQPPSGDPSGHIGRTSPQKNRQGKQKSWYVLTSAIMYVNATFIRQKTLSANNINK